MRVNTILTVDGSNWRISGVYIHTSRWKSVHLWQHNRGSLIVGFLGQPLEDSDQIKQKCWDHFIGRV